MRTGYAMRKPGFGSSAARLDLLALDALGIKRPFSDIAVARAAVREWD